MFDKIKVLLVDDDQVDREDIKRILNKTLASCTIIEATTVKAGLLAYHQQDFDVVLLDYWMPLADGVEMLLKLRSESQSKNTAIVMMSTSEENELALKCIQAGAHDFLPKNEISPNRLLRAILHARKRFELEQELHTSYNKVKKMAEHDSLTGLFNRYHFEDSLKLAIANNHRDNRKIALLAIDLDHFKFINDNYGHDVGDALLKRVVFRIKSCLRGNECFARLGGDEFSIILTNISSELDATQVARRILMMLQKTFNIHEHEVRCGASIGIALYPDNAESAEELVQQADIAMYRSKKLGRNQLCFFEMRMQKEFTQRYKVEQGLRAALDNDEFHLFYQPVFSASNPIPIGFEALIRWNNPVANLGPAEFIPIAEESRLIIEIGEWVIKHAIIQLAIWQKNFNRDLTMAINISPMQLADNSVIELISSNLQQFKISAESLTIEITETALLGEESKKDQQIQSIRELGCGLALDDFGTGFSSISHLLKFPISSVKIDKSLMPTTDKLSKHRPLLRGLAAMLHSLELEIVAEGVENLEQFEICQELKIQRIQGYFLGKPAAPQDIERQWFASDN